jgi:acyl carrier protein
MSETTIGTEVQAENGFAESTFVTLRQLLVDVLCVAPAEVTPEADIVADLGAESIDIVDLSFQIEQAFHISDLDEGLRGQSKKLSVRNLALFVERQLRLTSPGVAGAAVTVGNAVGGAQGI